MKYSTILSLAIALAGVSPVVAQANANANANAVTHVVVETDVMAKNVDVEATVYEEDESTYVSGASTSTAAPVEVTSYRSTFVTSASTSSSSAAAAAANTQIQNKQINAESVAAAASSSTTTIAPTTTVAAVAAANTAGTYANTPYSSTSSTLATVAAATAQAQASASSSSSSGLNKFQKTMLEEHNAKRSLHQGVGSLTWSSTLAAYAQQYADSYSCPSNGQLTHSGGSYGENLASGYSDKGTVDAWYDEIKQYSYSSPGFSEATGHFSQLIWKGSKQLGCAYKKCNNEWGTYVVCEYYPMGNIVVTGDTTYWSSNVPALK